MMLSVVAMLAIVGLALTSADNTGLYIRQDAKNIGEACGPNDYCLRGYICMDGICKFNSGQIEILPGQLCITTTSCKYGYSCIEGRCQRR